ncbi:hypothetical protein [Herbaspirillum autotrophicum]|uniref:hypothetical protein n=1 Tax=Herbaspirillum autotrophicum TaxID=180195 RepID=UPI0012EEB293|nr:hypothetical protein [Herbaspirillum autotrophicum]
MKIAANNISFSKLLKSWRDYGEFSLYAKFLDESRKPMGSTVIGAARSEHRSVFFYLSLLYKKSKEIVQLVVLLFQCQFAPKNRVIIFNHTSRRRITEAGVRPFYLPNENFQLKNKIIFEDRAFNFAYPSGTVKLTSLALDRCSGIFVRLLALYARLVYGSYDTDILSFIVRFKLWEVVLRMLRPARVQVMVWYGKEPMIAACKELGIEIWDMQHGIIYEEHPIYNLIAANSVTGSSYLRPDKCLVYGEYWRQHLLRSGWPCDDVVVSGYFPDTNVGYAHVADAPYVLYTSQPHSNQLIIEHIRAIQGELKSRGWHALIALHPSENADGYRQILSDSVKITKFDSYDLLRNCMVHVSFTSTLLWEAMLFEKPSFILQYGREAVGLLSDLVRFGYGRTLTVDEFPEPFQLPQVPPREYFFAMTNKELLSN